MLASLFIQNYALIDRLSLDLSGGLVILTGETGAGKSIIVDALGMLLGERVGADVVRAGATKATIEGCFKVPDHEPLSTLLKHHELDTTDTLILRRELSAGGQNRCFINSTAVPLSVLRQAGDLLVDLHGQHEHQSLLRPATHILLLDAFCSFDEVLQQYRQAYKTIAEVNARLSDLRQHAQQVRELSDYYSFQLREIDSVGPRIDEEEHLQGEERILEQGETLSGETAQLYELLYQGEGSAYEILSETVSRLRTLASIDKRFELSLGEAESSIAVVRELARFVQTYREGTESNPARLEEVRARLARLAGLRRKYGGTMEAVLAHRAKVARELEVSGNIDEEMQKLSTERDTTKNECVRLARLLSRKRHRACATVERAVVQELKNLGIPNALFSVHITNAESVSEQDPMECRADDNTPACLTDRGFDKVEFMISTNRGEDVRPLARIASGGEISRIMLALKGIMAKRDRLPVMVFDEIDVGVSGRVAQAVGEKLRDLSQSHQVIAITHLPQIAGLADMHLAVEKSEEGARATTNVRLLSSEERIKEVARLLSGTTITDAALTGARELMGLS